MYLYTNKIINIGQIVASFLLVVILTTIFLLIPGQAAAQTISGIIINGAQKLGVDILWGVGTTLQALISLFTSLAGGLMEFALLENIKLSEHRGIIEIGWSISRDIANIFFIIILLGVAIATIFKIANYQAKALLPKLIIIAILINFSLAIGFVIIDFTNVLGLQFYDAVITPYGNWTTAIMEGTKPQKTLVYEDSLQATAIDLYLQKYPTHTQTQADIAVRSAHGWWHSLAAGQLKKQGITPPANTIDASIEGAKKAWGNLILLSFMVFTFFAAAIMLMIRVAVLILLLVLAPLAFLLYILPDTRSLWTKWWNSFLSHAFFLPIYLFLLYFVVYFTTYIGRFTGQGNTFNDPSLFYTYVVSIVFLFAALILGKMMGVFGAAAAINVTTRLRRYTVGFIGGATAAAAYRNLVAKPAKATSQRIGRAGPGATQMDARLHKALEGIAAFKPGGRQSLIERQKEISSLKDLTMQQRGEKLQGLSIPQRDLALHDLSNKEIAELRYMHRNDADRVKSIDDTVKRITAGDEEKAEKIGEEIAKTFNHLPAEERYKAFAGADQKLQSAFARTWDKENIQTITNGFKQGSAEKLKFVQTLHDLQADPENKVSKDKLNAALSVAPALVAKLPNAQPKDVEKIINKVDFEKINKDEFAAAMKEVVDKATPKQAGKILERSDIGGEYVAQLQSRFNSLNKNLSKLADTFKTENSAMENQIRHNKVFTDRLGLKP